MRLLVSLVMSLACGAALAATVYKWVDENGVTHYSDQPHPGAQKLDVQSAQTYSAPAASSASTPTARTGPPAAQSGAVYEECVLFRPAQDEVLFDVNEVTAKVRLNPDLRAGDKVAIALDNKRMSDIEGNGNEFTLTSVYRGTHTLIAVVEDEQNHIVCRSPSVTFHVRQQSIFAPRSPTAPPPPKPKPKPPTRP